MSDPDTRRLWLVIEAPQDNAVRVTLSPFPPASDARAAFMVAGVLADDAPLTLDLALKP